VPIDFQKLSCNNTRYLIITFDDAFQSVIKNALPLLYQMKIPTTIFVPSGCIGEKAAWLQGTDHADKNEQVATLSQLLEINRDYVSIGSHSISHSHLPELNENDAMNEIKSSKLFLEKELNHKIKYIAFPFGEYNEKIIDLCKKSNYEQVFTIDTYSPYSSTTSYERGRVAIDPWDWTIEYRLKIMGAYSWMLMHPD
jgi:peptidoglycan/xylan/chitin deacetylase (PgdA/CDA1 family)